MTTSVSGFETLEDFCAERPPNWRKPEGEPQLDIGKLKVAAYHLLGYNNQPGGYPPGSFTAALIRAWELADNDNQAKLHSQWPELGQAIFVLTSQGGFDALRRITEGEAP